MTALKPRVGSELLISHVTYEFAPHPAARNLTYGQEGGRAKVYQIVTSGSGRRYALKVFKEKFRNQEIVDSASRLRDYKALPGLKVCDRVVLLKMNNKDLIEEYPELSFAVLMPWMDGDTWHDIVSAAKPLERGAGLVLASAMASVLAGLEREELAHCDVAGTNVVVAPGGQSVELVDVEEMFGSRWPMPSNISFGTVGYTHPVARSKGFWGAHADRFAGAVILCEMLAWHHPDVRASKFESSYFSDGEMGQDSERFQTLRRVLAKDRTPEMVKLLEQAWSSQTLAQCPSLADWRAVLQQAGVDHPKLPPPKPKPPLPPRPVPSGGGRSVWPVILILAGVILFFLALLAVVIVIGPV